MAATTEETSKPLDSAEIARMFEAMRTGTFQAMPEPQHQNKTAFTAKSLFDIARSATREDRVVGSDTAKAKAKAAIAEIEEAEVVGGAVVAEMAPAEAFAPMAQDGAVDLDAALGGLDDPVLQPLDLVAAPTPELGPRPANLDELKAEWGRGFTAGEERARADLSADVEARVAILETAILAFRGGDGIAKLRHEIIETVKDLASARAGAQIDDMPEAFLAKIEDLVDRIRTDLAQPRLRLNPEDIAAVKPYLQGSETLALVSITADPELARGDMELSTDGLRYADRVMPKPVAAAKAVRKTPSPDARPAGSDTGDAT